ncbi:MAG TPA: YceI family protein [Steroidobacteraceae bacterium]|nr:YceI family protein [Steroidobacteraceae bacterium]
MSMSASGSRFPRRSILAGLLSLGLWGCQTRPPASAPAPGPLAEQPAIPVGAREYKVVPGESLLQILVYRGGAMARLGHNHVIASHHLEGEVHVTEDPVATRFEIRVPVNELTVDEPAMRESAGSDFPPNVPQGARDGTRKNLLSEALLDGANYPAIRLRTTDVAAAGEGFDVGVEISLKDQLRSVRVPVQLERKDDALIARGEFALKQSDLGLKPFSVAMGTLVVLDEMKIRFEISAR